MCKCANRPLTHLRIHYISALFMIDLTAEELKQYFSDDIFKRISETADELGLECYVVGGYVRDIFLQRPSKDIDVVVVGSGIAMAEALGKRLGRGAHVSVFKNFGTAQLKYYGTEVEFVGARKESYTHDSRKPIVEDGTGRTASASPTVSKRIWPAVILPSMHWLFA